MFCAVVTALSASLSAVFAVVIALLFWVAWVRDSMAASSSACVSASDVAVSALPACSCALTRASSTGEVVEVVDSRAVVDTTLSVASLRLLAPAVTAEPEVVVDGCESAELWSLESSPLARATAAMSRSATATTMAMAPT